MRRSLEFCVSITLYVCAGTALVSGVLILLHQAIEYLSTERWPRLSLLDLAYHSGLVTGRWLLYPGAVELMQVMRWIPAGLFLILIAPLLWRLGLAIARS
jgi:hypothetical protein